MNAEWIDAPGDEEARSEARGRSDSGSFELWEKNRLIERFRRDQPNGG